MLEALPGAAVALDAERARVLGPVLRRLHDSRVSGHGAWPDWDAPETAVGAYHARSVTSALAWAGERTDVATAIAVRLPVPGPGDGPPFRRLHGDLWGGNLLWDAGAVRLVDWEYCRQGDPAEELAYLLEMDSVGEEVAEALLTAYGGPIAERVRAWRPLAALMAGLWFHDAGMDERGATLVERAAALCAAP